MLNFTVRHVGDTTGDLHVNELIEYTDKEQNAVKFPDPTVYVDCGEVIEPEPCPEPRELEAKSCTEAVTFDARRAVPRGAGAHRGAEPYDSERLPAPARGARRAADGRRGGRLPRASRPLPSRPTAARTAATCA